MLGRPVPAHASVAPSTADLAVILIDARQGIQTQSKRHAFIVSLLGVRRVVVAINKMDLVDYSEDTFGTIAEDYLTFAARVGLDDVIDDRAGQRQPSALNR